MGKEDSVFVFIMARPLGRGAILLTVHGEALTQRPRSHPGHPVGQTPVPPTAAKHMGIDRNWPRKVV